MATLTREHTSLHSSSVTDLQSDPVLDTNVPAPFPTHLMQIIMDEPRPPSEPTQPLHDDSTAVSTDPPRERPTLHIAQVESTANHEVGPSLTHVQQSCLMTLNNLLSQDAHMWQPIVPTRRHSLPAPSPVNASTGIQTLLTSPSSSSALQTLVSNLRYRDDPEMREIVSDGDASLLRELDSRVTAIVDEHLLDPRDARLAKSLVSLLTHLNRLSIISPEPWPRSPVDSPQANSSFNVYDTLSWQVSELQLRRDAHVGDMDAGSSTMQAPVQVVERALLWNKIDQDLDEVSQLCRERTEIVSRPFSPKESQLPPEYDAGDYEPPSYDPAEYSEQKLGHKSQDSSSMTYMSSSQSILDEKMRLDLEAVTMAIDRLYLVAPQLLNQRAELKRSKIEQMERAKASGSDSGGTVSMASPSPKRLHKGKEVARGASFAISKMSEKDMRELDSMLELINKASTRRIEGQSVVLHGESEMAERAEKARLRNLEKRDAFHERLVTHSNTGRLTSQDAVLIRSPSAISLGTKTKNPDALLSLPEFIREDLPDNVAQARDPEALLTLPEFVREPPPPSPQQQQQQQPATSASETTTINSVAASATKFIKRPFMPSRSRSLSAPPLALARLIAGTSSIARVTSSLHPDAAAPEEGRQWTPIRGLDVQFVAEHQENLHSVVVFLQVSGKQQAGINIEAEVVPSRARERLMIKCGTSTSAPLCLPARVAPGKKEVKVQSGHLEVKLECSSTATTEEKTPPSMPPNGVLGNDDDVLLGTGPLDAAQLKALRPMSFICASCSLPLVQSSRLARYDDLPSEHWAELLEAWMCHADQKVSDGVAQYARQEGGGGGWLAPARGQALVGGSYVLFESSAVMMDNIRPNDISAMKDPDDWNPVRCICGAVTGRCRQHNGQTTYRLAKYAIRPVSPSSDPLQIPLSAFILQDMDELVHAHATYRFVILDEEDEKPRILIWMFKQFIRISYATSNHYFLARSASVQAAKVHFKILGPSVSPTIKSTLEKYPGFSQSERLLYPLDICRRLAGLLKESNNAYPQGRRVMAGLDVGWLTRV